MECQGCIYQNQKSKKQFTHLTPAIFNRCYYRLLYFRVKKSCNLAAYLRIGWQHQNSLHFLNFQSPHTDSTRELVEVLKKIERLLQQSALTALIPDLKI